MIGIVDYGAGNIKSIENAFLSVGAKIKLVKDPDELIRFDRIVLPGVGAFKDAMEILKKINLDEAIKDFIKTGKPFLGICLGLQLLFETSEEFETSNGLGILKGKVVKFDKSKFDKNLKIPHIGWNSLELRKTSQLTKNLKDKPYMYFVHSYHIECNKDILLSKTFYGYEFTSAIEKDNVFGLQPHPEKSGEVGLKIVKNFMEI
ncbi:imidazole glycerol phosphate synthase HisFH, HisH subunit [Campylobacter blaseri]|uniref:Imidazole glycerol phosphate synthase subunit HisH n=1 Tax=Campylobacter blaseri TaxID=2042961 RepID=A0A2P8R1G3_9BACT|nr:imidazole glycerol phosphate synthase subunit HisH [Campylobacter blaseri]PSM52332.1 imidazole glycerol phosphate synthase subunit HisH [Campylobacter blaseri]PSM54098.1 imidazole glycerol phosphate synthase subunit HisH [Campylobacter blaseri]QKF85540.1 imidazole glycerol phosphate synthase HisFH, HisH subunit [Campylobacter blaseri]